MVWLLVLGILNVHKMLMHSIAHVDCTANTVRESALEADSGEKRPLPHRGLEPTSVLRLAFQSDALSTSELSRP